MGKNKFYLAYFSNELPPKIGLKKIPFFSSIEKIITDKTEFYLGFDLTKEFLKEDLEIRVRYGILTKFSSPLNRIKESECLWADKNKDLYIADSENPYKRKRKVKSMPKKLKKSYKVIESALLKGAKNIEMPFQQNNPQSIKEPGLADY